MFLKMSVLQENRKQILTDKDSIARVSEDDLSKCLKTLSCVFEEFGSENMALEQFYIIDKTQVKKKTRMKTLIKAIRRTKIY